MMIEIFFWICSFMWMFVSIIIRFIFIVWRFFKMMIIMMIINWIVGMFFMMMFVFLVSSLMFSDMFFFLFFVPCNLIFQSVE